MEDGIPSLPLTDALFDDANWAQGVQLPENEDMDVFSLVDTLGLDEDLALHDVDTLSTWPAPQGHAQHKCAQDIQEHQPEVPKPDTQRKGQKSKEDQRLERIRARNREAQARYRQKAKGQAADLECSISAVQSAVTNARGRQQHLQDQNTQLQQRCSNSSASLEAILSVSNLIPASPPVPSHAGAGYPDTAAGQSQMEPAFAPAEAVSPAVPTGSTSSGTSLITTERGRQPTDSIFSPQPGSATPRPLSSYMHRKVISLQHVGWSVGGSAPTTDDSSALWDDEEPPVTGKLDVRKRLEDYRAAEARNCGCDVSDISWFVQTRVDMAANLANNESSMVGQDTATMTHNLAFSTSFSSGPCIASFTLLYLHLAIENSAVVRAMDILEGAAPEHVASQLSTCGLDEASSMSYGAETLCYSKRRRDDHGGSISIPVQRPKVPKSTADLLASAGLTYAHFDMCNVRCGKNDVYPLRKAVENAFSSTIVRLSGVMPLSLMQHCFEQAIETIDRMLIGFMKGLRPTASGHTTPSHSGLSEDSHQASLAGAGVSFEMDTDGTSTTGTCPSNCTEDTKQAEHATSWEERYEQETNLHAVCTILAVRQQLIIFLDDIHSIAARGSPSDRLTTKPQLLHHIRQLSDDFRFSELVSRIDSPKVVFNMIMGAFQPFLGQYYLMDNMHVNLYRKLKPNALQRSLMGEFWLAQANRKRNLDAHIHTARSLLAALPSDIPLPLDFFTHLNNLVAAGTPSPQGAHPLMSRPASQMSVSLAKQLTPVFTRSSITSQAAHHLDSCFQRPSSLASSMLSWNMDGDLAHPSFSIGSRQYSALSLSQHSSNVGMSHVPGDETEVRFMGQNAEDMVRAEMVLRELRTLQDAGRNLQADVLNADMAGVLLQVDKQTRLWADHFMSQMMPPDFLELCQMAASQQNRFNLFEQPFK